MKAKLGILIGIAFIIAACTNPKGEAIGRIEKAEADLYDTSSFKLNKTTAINLIQQYKDFATEFKEDTLAPNYLYKAGELSMNLGLGSQAIQYFKMVDEDYPSYSKMPQVVFMQAFIQENLLGDTVRAKFYYNRFIDQYPDHPLTEDAKASIRNMGKSLEELIKEFEKSDQE